MKRYRVAVSSVLQFFWSKCFTHNREPLTAEGYSHLVDDADVAFDYFKQQNMRE